MQRNSTPFANPEVLSRALTTFPEAAGRLGWGTQRLAGGIEAGTVPLGVVTDGAGRRFVRTAELDAFIKGTGAAA